MVDRHAGARIDDLVANYEHRIFLRCTVGVYSQACEPSRAAEMAYRPRPGNFQRTQLSRARKNASNVGRDDLAIVRFGKIGLERRLRQILNGAAGGASRQTDSKREDAQTHSPINPLTLPD